VSKARDYISDLAANGRYHFAADEMRVIDHLNPPFFELRTGK